MTIVFLADGIGFGTWAGSLARVKEAFGLADTSLGAVLLLVSVGAIAGMTVAGSLAARFGTARIPAAAGLVFALALPLPAVAPGWPALMAAAMVLGAGNGALDVAMNAHASEVEKRWGAAIMSSFHAAWSVGSMAGSALAGVLIGANWSLASILGLAAALVAILSAAGFRLRNAPGHSARRPGFALPGRTMLGICAITCLCFFAEGVLMDWSAVYLRTVLAVTPALAPSGFAAFEFAMAGGRFAGDTVVRRLGPATTLRIGGLLGAVGMAMVLLASAHELAIAGFVVIGLGVSNVVPVAFSAAGRERGPGGVAMAASTGYGGMIAGPPLIGPFADLVGLRIALGTVFVAVLAVTALARTVTAKQHAPVQSLV